MTRSITDVLGAEAMRLAERLMHEVARDAMEDPARDAGDSVMFDPKRALSAFALAAAIIMEANPKPRTIGALRKEARKEVEVIETLVRMLRAEHERTGVSWFEQAFGGRVEEPN